MTIEVFLLDDHEVVRRHRMRALLEGDGCGDIEVMGAASTADEALRRLPATRGAMPP